MEVAQPLTTFLRPSCRYFGASAHGTTKAKLIFPGGDDTSDGALQFLSEGTGACAYWMLPKKGMTWYM